jgi:hypothetical protein
VELPPHAYEVTIRIGGDDWEYVERALAEISTHLPDHGPDCNMCSGGAGGSHSVSVVTRDVTPEQFRAELEKWRQRMIELREQEKAVKS